MSVTDLRLTTDDSEFGLDSLKSDSEVPCTSASGSDVRLDASAEAIDEFSSSDVDSGTHNGTPVGFAFTILRWPLLMFISSFILFELIAYMIIRLIVFVQEQSVKLILWMRARGKTRKALFKALADANSFADYKSVALKLDEIMSNDKWKNQPESAYYDFRLIKRVTRNLITCRAIIGRHNDQQYNIHAIKQLKRVLLDGALKTNLGGVENYQLYSNTFFDTKEAINDYVEEVNLSLHTFKESPYFTADQKYKFFRKAAKMYGRSALCLSGGATLGYFHLGVVKALLNDGCLPNVIAGTSAGSLIAAFVCVRTDDELRPLINADLHEKFNACDQSAFQMLSRLLKTGAAFDPHIWLPKLQWVTKGDMTFLEAYELSGRILNITVISEKEHSPPKLLNYKTTPDILINSAVLASSAVPGILPRMELKRKLPDGSIETYLDEGHYWRDGSLRIDIPISSLHQMFQVNYTIVSQVNPHITVFFFENQGSVGLPHVHRSGKGWRGGFLLSSLEHSLKLDMKKWLRIVRDLQLMPNIHSQNWSHVWLQQFHGSVTILPKSSLSDYYHILTDPDRKRMENYIITGMRCTWPKLKMIENRLRIETTIWDACKEFKRAVKKR